VRRRWRWVVLAGLALALGAALYAVRPILRGADAAAEYVARRACLCVFADGRSLPACLSEMPDVVAQVEAELLEEERAVRAHLSILATRTARFQGGTLCTVD